jgi:hypothetical protein
MTIPVLGLVLLEVMDKEWTVPQMWASFLFLGLAAALLARWSVIASLCVGVLIVLIAMGQHAELTDPYVGPAIRREAGDAYFVHSYVAMAVALAMCLIPVAWEISKRLRRRKAFVASAA